MKRALGVLAALALLGALAALLWSTRQPPEAAEPQSPVSFLAGGDPDAGFARATGPEPLRFPRDHGPHPDYQTEWWYYTGNLEAAGGRHFGYQLTFFRRALLPPSLRQTRASDWATDQVYLAHFALTDVAGERYRAFERFARGAAGVAGAQAEPYRVWLGDWSVELAGPDAYRLRAQEGGIGLDLALEDSKGPSLQGDRGYSRKGPEPGNASFYYSQTRLRAAGTVRLDSERHPVSGLGWMDHEYSTDALGAGLVGWDWFALQLDDGTEVMLFQLRRADGSADSYSAGTLIAPDGSTLPFSLSGNGGPGFDMGVTRTWRSPRSGAVYPAGWSVSIPDAGLSLEIEPYLADQELNVSFAYWEGAVRVNGAREGRAVSGSGYVEMTGYADTTQSPGGPIPGGSP